MARALSQALWSARHLVQTVFYLTAFLFGGRAFIALGKQYIPTKKQQSAIKLVRNVPMVHNRQCSQQLLLVPLDYNFRKWREKKSKEALT